MQLFNGVNYSSQYLLILVLLTNNFRLNSSDELKTLKTLNARLEAQMNLIVLNFTQTVRHLTQERDKALKDQAVDLEDAARLRSENNLLNEQITTFTRCCPSTPNARCTSD